jgi:putative ABC transport system permease protein
VAEAVGRLEYTYPGVTLHVFIAVAGAALLTCGWTLFVVLRVGASAQYAIPVAGILLGNSIVKVSLGVSAVLTELAESPGRVEQLLALGATRFEATAPLLRRALSTALLPLLNTLSVAGIVSIPGMMTGQMMGGTAPEQAARYQIMILFAIAGTACASLLVACELAVWAVLDGEAHRVRRELLSPRVKRNAGTTDESLPRRLFNAVFAPAGALARRAWAWLGGTRAGGRDYQNIEATDEDGDGGGVGGDDVSDNIEPRQPA